MHWHSFPSTFPAGAEVKCLHPAQTRSWPQHLEQQSLHPGEAQPQARRRNPRAGDAARIDFTKCATAASCCAARMGADATGTIAWEKSFRVMLLSGLHRLNASDLFAKVRPTFQEASRRCSLPQGNCAMARLW